MTKIQWTERTWNPCVGCTIISAGCKRCYAMTQAHRLNVQLGVPKYKGLTHVVRNRAVWSGIVRIDENSLDKPLDVRRPTMWFVNSMSDLFHEALTWSDIDRIFNVMASCPQHIFQVLTKRADLMERYARYRLNQSDWVWPLKNVWLGVSVERQQEASQRIPYLLRTPAAVRWISAEPLLGPIDLTDLVIKDKGSEHHFGCLECDVDVEDDGDFGGATLDWVVVGGESGRGARNCNPSWIKAIIKQCQIYGTPVFVKQLGANCGMRLKHPKGGDIDEFPEELRIRQWPTKHAPAPNALLI